MVQEGSAGKEGPERRLVPAKGATGGSKAKKRFTQPMDKADPLRRDLKRTVLGIEARLQAVGKVFKVNPYNIASIKKKLVKANPGLDDPLVKEIKDIEEMLVLMAKIFNKPLDPRAVNKFIAAMHRHVLSPTRQARITEYFHIAAAKERDPGVEPD